MPLHRFTVVALRLLVSVSRFPFCRFSQHIASTTLLSVSSPALSSPYGRAAKPGQRNLVVGGRRHAMTFQTPFRTPFRTPFHTLGTAVACHRPNLKWHTAIVMGTQIASRAYKRTRAVSRVSGGEEHRAQGSAGTVWKYIYIYIYIYI